MQIDNPERGFSYKFDGPLDLRLDPERGITAAERLRELDEEELEGMLAENADEPYGAEIAAAVGYESQGKFARVFREVLGVTPTEYRRGK